jgi:hypothetical protein
VRRAYFHLVRDAKWTNQQKGLAAQIIAATGVLPLGAIIAEAVRQGMPKIAISTLHQCPEIVLLTLKRVQLTHAIRNSPPTKNDRMP